MKMLDPWKERGLKMVDELPRRRNGYPIQPAMRWTKDSNGRVLPLNSAAWRKLRKQVLAEEPLCRHCAAQGLTVPSTEVDHMRGAADNSRDALQALCKPCHSIKTMAELYGRPARQGCDVDGWPINPSHHFNEAAVSPSGASGGDDEQKSPAAEGPEPTCTPHAIANRGNEP